MLDEPRTAVGCEASYRATRDQFSNDGKGTFEQWLAAEGFKADPYLAADGGLLGFARGYRNAYRVVEVDKSFLLCADSNAQFMYCPPDQAQSASTWRLYQNPSLLHPSISPRPVITPVPASAFAQATLTSPLEQCEQFRIRVLSAVNTTLPATASTSGFTIPETNVYVVGCSVSVATMLFTGPASQWSAFNGIVSTEGFELFAYPYRTAPGDNFATYRRGNQIIRVDLTQCPWYSPCDGTKVQWYEL